MPRLALIPAAGRGARLDRPGTPKPLVEVGGQAMVVRLLRQLSQAGVERAVVVVGYRGARVARALRDCQELGLEVEIVHNARWKEGLLGSILSARGSIREPFVLAMSDHVFDDALVHAMTSAGAPPDGVSLLVDPRVEEHDLESAVTV